MVKISLHPILPSPSPLRFCVWQHTLVAIASGWPFCHAETHVIATKRRVEVTRALTGFYFLL
jgi:hypothetical protein